MLSKMNTICNKSLPSCNVTFESCFSLDIWCVHWECRCCGVAVHSEHCPCPRKPPYSRSCVHPLPTTHSLGRQGPRSIRKNRGKWHRLTNIRRRIPWLRPQSRLHGIVFACLCRYLGFYCQIQNPCVKAHGKLPQIPPSGRRQSPRVSTHGTDIRMGLVCIAGTHIFFISLPPSPSEVNLGTLDLHTIVPLYHCTMVPLYHSTIVPRYHCTMVPLSHCTMVPWYSLLSCLVHSWLRPLGREASTTFNNFLLWQANLFELKFKVV